MSYARVVRRGVALLDEKHPGWESKITVRNGGSREPHELDMSKGYACILGQLYDGGYERGSNLMFPDAKSAKAADRQCRKYGFERGLFSYDHEKLTDEWKRVIFLRLDAQKRAETEEEVPR